MDDYGPVTDDDRARWLRQAPHQRAVAAAMAAPAPFIDLTDLAGATPDLRNSRVVLEAGTAGARLLLLIDDNHLS